MTTVARCPCAFFPATRGSATLRRVLAAQFAKVIGRHVLCANVNDARSAILAVGQKDSEIEIVRENHAVVVAGPLHDFGVRGVAGTDDRPVNRLEAVPLEERHPLGRQIQIDEQSHTTAKGTSCSSTRQAA